MMGGILLDSVIAIIVFVFSFWLFDGWIAIVSFVILMFAVEFLIWKFVRLG